MSTQVMISLHTKSMKPSSQLLAEHLRKIGIQVWVCYEMKGGVDFRKSIVESIRNADVVILLINRDWADSGECYDEFHFAKRRNLTSHERKITKKGEHRLPVLLPVSFSDLGDLSSYDHLELLASTTNFIRHKGKTLMEGDSETSLKLVEAAIQHLSSFLMSVKQDPILQAMKNQEEWLKREQEFLAKIDALERDKKELIQQKDEYRVKMEKAHEELSKQGLHIAELNLKNRGKEQEMHHDDAEVEELCEKAKRNMGNHQILDALLDFHKAHILEPTYTLAKEGVEMCITDLKHEKERDTDHISELEVEKRNWQLLHEARLNQVEHDKARGEYEKAKKVASDKVELLETHLNFFRQHVVLLPKEKAFRELLKDIKNLIKSKPLQKPRNINCFISYAWEEAKAPEGKEQRESMKKWLCRLQHHLEKFPVDVFLDLRDIRGDMRHTMEERVRYSDFTFLIGTEKYKERVEKGLPEKFSECMKIGNKEKFNKYLEILKLGPSDNPEYESVNPSTNVAYEFIHIWAKALEKPTSVVPLLFQGTYATSFPSFLSSKQIFLSAKDNYEDLLTKMEDPIGLIPWIFELNSAKNKALHKGYRDALESYRSRCNEIDMGLELAERKVSDNPTK